MAECGIWRRLQKRLLRDVLSKKIDIETIDVDLFGQYVSLNDLPAVDLLIRNR